MRALATRIHLDRQALGRLPFGIPAGVLIALALLGFWRLSRGMTLGPGAIVAYAEELPHSVGPLEGGRLKEITVRLGQPVHAGDVLAQLDPQKLELARERLQAELAQAQAELAAQEDLQGAQLQRGQIQAVRAHAAEERARAELQELTRQVDRLAALRTENLVHASALEEARRRQQAVAADLAARPGGTARELELMGLRPRPQTDQSTRLDERLAPFRAALRVKEAALHQTEYALRELTLRAPVDGTVGAILQRPGDVLAAGAPVVTLVTARAGHVVAFVPERQVGRVAAGSPVQLRRIGALGSALRGHVTELAPMLEEVPLRARPAPAVSLWARRVVITLDQPASLLPGEAFRVSAR